MQLYTLCVGWLYLAEMRAWEDPILLTFPRSNIVRVSIWSETNAYNCEAKQSFHKSTSCFKLMKYGNPSSNVYQPFLLAAIRTFNPLLKHIGANRLWTLTKQMIHPWIWPFPASNWSKNGNPSSNVYQSFLSAVIHTFNPFNKLSGAIISNSVHVSK